jgi:hypothetical protein
LGGGGLCGNEARMNCEQCGRPLNGADGICQSCDSEIVPAVERPVPVGKYFCPACKLKFAKPEIVLWPSKVKWYKPQGQRERCPHCQVVLRPKGNRIRYDILTLNSVVILKLTFGFPNVYFLIAFYIIGAGSFAVTSVTLYRQYRYPEKYYVVDDSVKASEFNASEGLSQ